VAFLRPPDPTLAFNLPARNGTLRLRMAWSDKGGRAGVSCSDFEADSEGNLWRAHLFFRRSLPLHSPRIQPRGFPRPRPRHHTLGGVLVLANDRVIGNPTNGACVYLVGAE
jgi:hypothetical protein